MTAKEDRLISFNKKQHNLDYDEYDKFHEGDIMHSIEQNRIKEHLERIANELDTKNNRVKALDFGCGTGNLTKVLKSLNYEVTSADVSNKFLELVKSKYDVDTILLNGKDISNIEDNSYNLVALYSVLHHVPNYLKVIEELLRILKPNGVLYIDHEVNETYWKHNDVYANYLNAIPKPAKSGFTITKLVDFLVVMIRKLPFTNRFPRTHILNPRYQKYGDIHVWPDDHIEWEKIKSSLQPHIKKIEFHDYLMYKSIVPMDTWIAYKDLVSDYRTCIAYKC